MGRLKRSVTYCMNETCDQWIKPRFHLGPILDAELLCCKCAGNAVIVSESFDYSGGNPCRQVRVEFNYCPLDERYLGLVIVTNEDLLEGGVYTFKTPLLKTQRRALQVAEERLSNLSLNQLADSLPAYINFDLPLEDVKRALRALVPGLESLAGNQQAEHEDHGRSGQGRESYVTCLSVN